MRPPPRVDVYLLPAVVGGGLGDIEEVLAAARHLARHGIVASLYRRPDHPMPPAVEGPWAWPEGLRRTNRVRPTHPRALTISAWWGVTAAPARDERLGRAGAWAPEARDIEEAYGHGRVLHASFEEFARTLTSREQVVERFREGGVPAHQIRERLRGPGGVAEVRRFREDYARFRSFERPDLLHLFTTFAPSRAFAREFPAAVQCGPLWPHLSRVVRRTRSRSRTCVWYASPSTAERLLPEVLEGLERSRRYARLSIGAAARWKLDARAGRVRVERLGPEAPEVWRARFQAADLRIVTGSRTLLEALELGRPFLYFNGALGAGGRSRRHRPEKIRALLRAWDRQDVDAQVRRDIDAFSRGDRVAEIVRRAATDPTWTDRFPARRPVSGFTPPFDDAAGLLVEVVHRLAARESASEIVSDLRGRSRAGILGAGRGSHRRPLPGATAAARRTAVGTLRRVRVNP